MKISSAAHFYMYFVRQAKKFEFSKETQKKKNKTLFIVDIFCVYFAGQTEKVFCKQFLTHKTKQKKLKQKEN